LRVHNSAYFPYIKTFLAHAADLFDTYHLVVMIMMMTLPRLIYI